MTKEALSETIRSALEAEDLRSVDAMYQTFEEIRAVFGGDFTVAESGDLEDETHYAVELYRNEPNSQIFCLYWSQHYNKWALMDIDEDCNDCADTDEMVAHLVSLVFA